MQGYGNPTVSGGYRLSVDGDQVMLVDYALRSVDANIQRLPEMQDAVDELKEGIIARYGDVYHLPLAWAEDEIANVSNPGGAKRDSPLGNLFTDAYRALTGTDIAIEASGLLADPIPAGAVVGADVFRAMSYGFPFGTIVRPYRLFTFRATGLALVTALEKTLAAGGDYFPQVSGMRLRYDSSLPYDPTLAGFQRILPDSVHVGGIRLSPDALYSVTTTEYVYSALKSLGLTMQDVVKLDESAFAAARTLVTQRGILGAAASNRIRDAAGADRER